jgi:two-component system cell cycle sensor histidine kinase/response regulator CckA
MPGMNGRELSDRLRKRYPELLTLFMSGYPHNVIGDRGILNPGVAFIEKSFTSKSFLQKVRQMLDHEKHKN